MGREVRRVPKTWEHPKGEDGNYIPLFQFNDYTPNEIAEGVRDGWLDPEKPEYGLPLMPDWPPSERTHWQMYETVSEGTPISPPCESAEALARWLADNDGDAGAGATASYLDWLDMIQGCGSSHSFSLEGGEFVSGVSSVANAARRRKS